LKQFQVKVSIKLRSSVLDPAGEAVKSAAIKLGVEGVKSLRIGKMIDIHIDATEKQDAIEKIEFLCDRLFANKVIEDYEYSFENINE